MKTLDLLGLIAGIIFGLYGIYGIIMASYYYLSAGAFSLTAGIGVLTSLALTYSIVWLTFKNVKIKRR